MAEQSPFLSLPKDWPYVMALAGFFGGLAGFANGLRTNRHEFPCSRNALDFLLGALAGIIGVGLIRPGDALGILTTSGLAGWLKDAFISERASQLLSAKASVAEEMLEDLNNIAEEVDEEEDDRGGGGGESGPPKPPSPANSDLASAREKALGEIATALATDFSAVMLQDRTLREEAFIELLERLPPTEQELAKKLKNIIINDPEGGK